MSVSFERNESATVALQNGVVIAGIETVPDGFKVNRDATSPLPEMGIFKTMKSAQEAIVDFSGDVLARNTSGTARERKARSTASGSSNASPAKRERKVSSAKHTSAKTAPVRNVSSIMQRNLDEIASGNLAVFVTDPPQFAQIASVRALKQLVKDAVLYKNGTGNIYPSPAQAKRIAKLLVGTDTALQCELGGYTQWRNSLRKKSSSVATS